MNKQIWKYKLSPAQEKYIMPKDAVVLCAKEQNGDICIWAEVDPSEKKEERRFEVFGTGHIIYYDMVVERVYIDTVILRNGLVFHVYERIF